jgi:hypothetical protein
MMHGRGKSDLVIVEPDEQGGAIATELVEPRAGTKGNAS